MTALRATTHLAAGANEMFDEWIKALRSAGLDISGSPGDDASLEADVVFACGLLTMIRTREGQPLRVVAAPLFAGEAEPVYRSVIVVRADSAIEGFETGAALSLGVNEYGSWSGWHGLKEHLRVNNVAASGVAAQVLTGGHVHSIEAVLQGQVDVASIDSSVWDTCRAADPRLRALRVIETTRSWPAPPISIRSTLPVAVQTQLTTSLLSLPDVHPAGKSDYAFMLTEVDDHSGWL